MTQSLSNHKKRGNCNPSNDTKCSSVTILHFIDKEEIEIFFVTTGRGKKRKLHPAAHFNFVFHQISRLRFYCVNASVSKAPPFLFAILDRRIIEQERSFFFVTMQSQ